MSSSVQYPKPSEPEFEQAFNELNSTLENSTLFEKRPELKKALDIAAIPERTIMFRVLWEDDNGKTNVNTGYRVQYSSVLGPYKGGLRFHPSVNLSILKFLGFEQVFKNALTGLSMGGAKGGADFDPKGKSDNEIRRFCNAFMAELNRHIGANTDVPAGDIGVGGREIGFLFGAYRRAANKWEGVLTGKGTHWGGSHIRPEATGYGLVYYVQRMIHYTEHSDSLEGKLVAISGSGNVAQYAALKVIELGGKVLTLSDSKGSIIATNPDVGITAAHISKIATLKSNRKALSDLFDSKSDDGHADDLRFIPGDRPWKHLDKVDIVLPSATQNEVSEDEAEALVAAGARYVAEGSNMGCTLEAIEVFEKTRLQAKSQDSRPCTWYAPGKAANAGGVAVSGLEMAQNSQRLSWTAEQVDDQLKAIMHECFEVCLKTALEYTSVSSGAPLPSLVAGANIAGFIKVADAMAHQGDVW